MKFLIVVVAILATVYGQNQPTEPKYDPIPYAFNYVADTEDGGSSSRQESGDGAGSVRGSYEISNLEGHKRVVEYEAGPDGFNAVVRTNEPGTDNSSPAGVIVESSASEAQSPASNAAAGPQRQNVRYVLRPAA